MATNKKSKETAAAERRLPKRYTGRVLVRLDPDAGVERLLRKAKAGGLNLGVGVDGSGKEVDGVLLEKLKVALVNEAAADRVSGLLKEKNGPFLSADPERYLRLLQAGSKGRGKKSILKDGVAATWGIQAINAVGSRFTGKGVKVAVLDTGFARGGTYSILL
jgi:hypothetical protein